MTDSGWQLEGNAAEAYEEYLVPAIFASCARRLVETAGVEAGDRVLDVACGTGIVARTAARRVGPEGTVTGVDINPDMLATAGKAGAGQVPAIDWQQGDVAALPLPDDSFDVVLCQEALQFFPDRPAALREMRRVAAPGGRVAFSVLRSVEHNPVYATFVRALAEHAGREAAEMMRSPFAFGDADALRELARDAGLQDVQVRIVIGEERFPSVEEMVRREAASSPLAGPLGALAEERRAALVEALSRELAGQRDDLGLSFHNETHVVTGSA